jgi:hypothetical protein
MPTEKSSNIGGNFKLSLDSWAVILALLLALAVRFDVLKKIPW